MESRAGKRRVQPGTLILIGFVLFLIVIGAVSLQLLMPRGWSKDVVLDDGQVKVLAQFKSESGPLSAQSRTLMARVKDAAGFPMRADRVYFRVSKDGQALAESLKGEPVGNFRASDDGFYIAQVELPSPGSYQVDLLLQGINLGIRKYDSRFQTSWPLEVE